MVKLVGPCLSLSASGVMADTYIFFYGRQGPVARRKSRYKPPFGTVWEINKELFKAASARWKSFSDIQKNAWKIFFRPVCDTARDLFMGSQIEFWNLSRTNDLSWPTVVLPEIKWPQVELYYDAGTNYTNVSTMFKEITYEEFQICGIKWYNSASSHNPLETDYLRSTVLPYTKFHSIELPKNHLWVKAYRVNGSLSGFKYFGPC